MNKVLTCAVGVLLLLPALAPLDAQSPPAGEYHDYQALSAALKRTAELNPGITSLISIGKSLEGRDLWLLRISGAKGDPLQKQALLVCANLEGNHLVGSEVALGMAAHLIRNYGSDEEVTRILDKRTFYIIPRLNPDGAEFFFRAPLVEHPGNLRPRDEDFDWKTDEDGPEDLNGDGFITWMRVKDPEGDWTIDEKDPRLMRKKEDGAPLDKLYQLYPEGTDDDGDEEYNEDGPGGFDIDRNFPHNFGYKPKGVGIYPASEAESLALLEFMGKYVPELKTQPHKNICGVLVFSKYDNLAAGSGIECGTPRFPAPPAAAAGASGRMGMFMMFGRRGAESAPQRPARDPQPKETETADVPLFKQVSEKYREITGIRSARSEKPAGSLLEYAYFQFGVPAFSANLWSLREAAVRPGGKRPGPAGAGMPAAAAPAAGTAAPSGERAARMRQMAARMSGGSGSGSPASDPAASDEKWLAWIDEQNNGEGFIEWKKFPHPQLGEVEIGGFQPYIKLNPPAEAVSGLIEKHAAFALHLADRFAEIEMAAPTVKKLSTRAFELSVTVRNRGGLPYCTAMGRRSQNISPIVLQLKFADDESMSLFGGSKRIDLDNLEAGAEKEYSWVIISPPGKTIDISLYARHGGGKSRLTATLR